MDIKAKRQEGASAVEFAIILPLLLILVFGIIEFSILFYDKAMITNASREGAREGIVFQPQYDPDTGEKILNHPLDAQIVATVAQYVQNHLISFDSGDVVTTTITRPPGDSPGDSLTVTVNYDYTFLVFDSLLSLVGGSLDGISLDAVTVMRME